MAKQAKKFNEVSVEEIPEVTRFAEVKAKYEAFKTANPEFFEYLNAVTEEYNSALEDAEKAVKSRQVSCGEFVLYQFATKYKPDILFQALGHDRFLAAGGVVQTKTVYEVDKTRVDSAIASGVIPPAVADQVRIKEARFYKPGKLELP